MAIKPRIFIGSSVEGLEVAYAIQDNLQYDALCTVWPQDVFKNSGYPLPDLIAAIKKNDFAIFVFLPDDVTIMRNQKTKTVRDNVIFELGLSIGHLGQEKVFFIQPMGANLHLPTDLIGLKPGVYDDNTRVEDIRATLGPFCNDVRKQLRGFIAIKEAEKEEKEKAEREKVENKVSTSTSRESNNKSTVTIKSSFEYTDQHLKLDVKVYLEIKRILPSNGVIGFIRQNNFAGFSFKSSTLDPLYEYNSKLSNPDFEFLDDQLEETRQKMNKHIKEFTSLIAVNTWPLQGNTKYSTVPPEWEIEQTERFETVVDALHTLASGICENYDDLTRLARRKLGVTGAS